MGIACCFALYHPSPRRWSEPGWVLGLGWVVALGISLFEVGNTPELVSVWCWLSVTVDIPILFACWWNRRGKRFRERRDGKLVEVGPAFDF